MNINVETALKTIVSTVTPEGEEPMSEYDDKPVECVLSPLSVVSRMTVDVFFKGYLQKIIYLLGKDKIKKIIER